MSDSYRPARPGPEPRPVHPSLAISAAVITQAEEWVLYGDPPRLRCRRCDQSVITTGTLTVGALSTSLLAHLMQRHGWTREDAGDES
jgi:hypothetical protein